MISLAVPSLNGNEAKYLARCIDDTFVSSVGSFVDRFEQDLMHCSGGEFVAATNSGSVAIFLALKACGVGPGDLVIVPSFTFIATANAVALCGAKVWLVDIDANSLTMDPNQLEVILRTQVQVDGDAIRHTDSGQRVAAVLPVYTLGHPPDMARIVEIAGQYNLPVVADAAPALGCRYHGAPVGIHGASLTALSFNGNKTITCGGGGAVIGENQELVDRACHLSKNARAGSDYDHDALGINCRMINLAAAVGCAQLERLDEFLAAKRTIKERYDAELGGLDGFSPIPEAEWAESACWFSGALVDMQHTDVLPEFRNRLTGRGIDARPFWKPLHLQSALSGSLQADLNWTNENWERFLILPCSVGLSETDQDYVVDTVRRIAGELL